VTTYRRVPAAIFGDVVAWLEEYLQAAHGTKGGDSGRREDDSRRTPRMPAPSPD